MSNSYTPSPFCCTPSSSSMVYPCSDFNSPPLSTFCSCCYSPSPFYYQQVPSSHLTSFMFPSPSSSPCFPHNTQVSSYCLTSSTMLSPPVSSASPPQLQVESTSSKITRTQYSNKHRYLLNELFKRTPYPNTIQRDLMARQLGISREQVRIWFQNRRRLQTQRDSGERLATASELTALQQGKTCVDSNELKTLLNDIAKYKDAPPRLRLDDC